MTKESRDKMVDGLFDRISRFSPIEQIGIIKCVLRIVKIEHTKRFVLFVAKNEEYLDAKTILPSEELYEIGGSFSIKEVFGDDKWWEFSVKED